MLTDFDLKNHLWFCTENDAKYFRVEISADIFCFTNHNTSIQPMISRVVYIIIKLQFLQLIFKYQILQTFLLLTPRFTTSNLFQFLLLLFVIWILLSNVQASYFNSSHIVTSVFRIKYLFQYMSTCTYFCVRFVLHFDRSYVFQMCVKDHW